MEKKFYQVPESKVMEVRVQSLLNAATPGNDSPGPGGNGDQYEESRSKGGWEDED